MSHYYTYSFLLTSLISFLLAIFVISKNIKSKLNVSFGFFALAVSLWGIFYAFFTVASSVNEALFWDRLLMAGAVLIPSTFTHFVLVQLGDDNEYVIPVIINYFIGLLFLLALPTPLFIKGIRHLHGFEYWPTPGWLFHFFFIWFGLNVIAAHLLMLNAMRVSSGLRRNQILYVFLGTTIGFIGGSTNYFLWYGIPIPPIGSPLVAVYVITIAYAITKHRLMDISVVISRTVAEIMAILIHSTIYLGLVWLSWTYVSASIGPAFLIMTVLYGILVGQTHQPLRLFIQTTTDKAFLRGKYDYYKELSGMSRQITKTLSMENILASLQKTFHDILEVSNPRIYLPEDFGRPEVKDWLAVRDVTVKGDDLVIPCLLEDRLIALIVLGKKLSEDNYSDEDIRLLQALASQTAIAIDHTHTYEEIKKELEVHQKKLYDTERVLAKSERIASMASLIQEYNHHIRTPLAIMSTKLDNLPDNPQEIGDFKAVKDYCRKQLRRASEIVDSTLRISTPKTHHENELNLNETIEAALDFYQPIGINVIKELSPLPQMKGDFEDLKLVFINLLKNAREAIPDKGTIKIKTYAADENGVKLVYAEVSDTGIGIAAENIEKIFEPFFSTHVTEGRGLGLSIVFRIVREHLGQINVKSKPGEGATFVLKFPVDH